MPPRTDGLKPGQCWRLADFMAVVRDGARVAPS